MKIQTQNGIGMRAAGMVSVLALVLNTHAATIANLSFTNIAEMLLSTRTNITADVDSYYGTEDANGVAFGGGRFKWFPSHKQTNFGTVFNAKRYGQWIRSKESHSVVYAAWFGILDSWSETGSSYFDSTERAQSALNTCPSPGVVLFPDATIHAALVLFKRSGITLRGEPARQGARNGFSDGPTIAYPNDAPTNGSVISIWNSPYCRVEGISIALDPAVNVPTNHAGTGIDVDIVDPSAIVTTGTILQDVFVLSRRSNTNAVGIHISRRSVKNVENTHINGYTFYGGASGENWDDNRTNGGIALILGQSDNVYETVLSHFDCEYASVGVIQKNGGIRIRDVYTFMLPLIYDLQARNTSTVIENDHSELPMQVARIRSGNGAVVFNGCTYNETPDITTTNSLFFIDGSNSGTVGLTLDHCNIATYGWRKVFGVYDTGDTFTSTLIGFQNQYGQATEAKAGWGEFDSYDLKAEYIGQKFISRTKGVSTFQGVQLVLNSVASLADLSPAMIGNGNVAIVNSNGVIYHYNVGLSGVLTVKRVSP